MKKKKKEKRKRNPNQVTPLSLVSFLLETHYINPNSNNFYSKKEKEKHEPKTQNKMKKARRRIYEHCSGGLARVAVDTKHGTGIGVELVHKVRLLLQNLVVVPHKVRPDLYPFTTTTIRKKKKKKKKE
ncbi:MAG: hypothetical protein O7C59_01500 [Rickettsia endosymbiont of Ixodes persulcatus]|nr:hypothetical protein [Rickettsia endosymbiont of Ixodes persulcatus]